MGIAESLKRGLDISADTAKEAVGAGKGRFIETLKYFVVGLLAAFAAAVAEISFLALLYFAALPAIGEVAALAVGGISALCALAVMCVLPLSAEFGAIEYAYSGKRVGYFEGRNVISAIKWALFGLLVVVAAAVPAAVVFLGLYTMGLEIAILTRLADILIMLVSIALGLAFYFAKQEMAIRRNGPLKAVSESVGIVRKNFWEVVLFAVLLYAVSEAIIAVPVIIMVFGMVIGIVPMLVSPSLLLVGIPIVALMVLGIFAVSLIVDAANTILIVGVYRRLLGGNAGRAG